MNNPLHFLPVDATIQTILTICLSILLFFTLLFYAWRFVRPRPFLKEMLDRTHSWWVIFFLYILFFCIEKNLGYVGLALLSASALYEFLGKLDDSQVPRSLRWLCFIMVPVQFVLCWRSEFLPAVVLIPVVFFVLGTVIVLLFEKTKVIITAPATALWAMLINVYGFAHLALLLSFPALPGSPTGAQGLFLFYIFLTQFNDVLQFLWGTILGRHKIHTEISPKKTWEGLIGGVVTTAVLAVLLHDLTPFDVTQSVIVGLLLATTGFLGDLTVSAIKRSLGLKDMGTVIPGHGGILDRIDSIVLSSLIYFYLVLYWFYSGRL